ncbi:ribosomal protection-like ABC-F family protein [Lacticaseibacillus zeae]|uniref:ABC-F type ribosomal protection protein n=1 Tax=Lacticaseibacillus zeae subsp. silagei TaxID=3068307 RepID=A0ABD7ZB02_LACZE|nr:MULTISPECIES: ABC-F type ribosomal protection protein [Lacticaseibacillus]MDE3314543.1 ABC-F type ribosomal protection protein [Lacticaseibacillus zeae]OFR92471.1 ABC-F type ribosomal protection protein [Lactobacillus sp. HMSC068F07]WLV84169.1 ABC-F type ribosomal protection protein [Lacticaseibacillus sp. NCIMB 15475]WLV86925.1 ABC-F type ribosomal protection protein [Lacticaseibacillus sp. NCIMB 15474]
MSTIQIKHLYFAYDGQAPLFSDAGFNLDTGWHLGLVGRNGRGKTTLLRLLQQQLYYRGSITVPVPLRYFPQPLNERQLTLHAAQAFQDVAQWQLERELNLLHAGPDILWRPFRDLSGGEQTKVRLALLFIQDDGFALIDEPTNHLDLRSRRQVAAYLKQKPGFIVVSHDRDFLDAVTDHTLAIERKKIMLYQGNYTTFTMEKQRQDQTELAQNAQLKTEISRLKQTAHAKKVWAEDKERSIYGDRHVKNSGHKGRGFISARAARTMKKSKNLEHRMDKEIATKEQLLKNLEKIDPLTMTPQPTHHHHLIVAENVQVGYNQPLFQPISFTLHPSDRVAIVGENGSGKSTLIRALLGHFTGTQTGLLTLAPVALSLVRQQYPDNRGLLPDFAEKRHLSLEALLNNLRKLGMPRADFVTPIEHLSMGQQKKVEVARSLATPASLYIWDEPLNYLDTYNQDQILTAINHYQPTMLFVEHDEHFINEIATKVVRLTPLT